MAAAAVLAIVVAVGEAHSRPSVALLAAVEESLGSSTSTRLVEVDTPTEANALRVERELGATAAVIVLWKEAAYVHATLRLHVARPDRWTFRSITFDSQDTLAERGRTLGLTVASMMPERPSSAARAVVETPPLAAEPLIAPAVSPSPPRKLQTPERLLAADGSFLPETPLPPQLPPPDSKNAPRAIAQPVPAPPAPVDSARLEAPLVRSVPHHLQIGMGALAAVGIGGSAQGGGGQLEGIWFWSQRWAVRSELGVRTGPVPALAGSDLVSAVGVGFEWWPLGDPRAAISSLGLRASLLLLDHRVTATGESSETRHSLLPGADFAAQFLVGITPRLSVVGCLGLETAFGPTELRKGEPPLVVARIPVLRLVGSLGLRVGF